MKRRRERRSETDAAGTEGHGGAKGVEATDGGLGPHQVWMFDVDGVTYQHDEPRITGGEIMALAGVLRTGIPLRNAAAHSALRSFVLQPPLHPTTTMRCSTRLTSRITSVYFGADLGTVAQGGEPMGTPVTEAFSTAQACRVVGVTYRQIDYWAHSRLVTPSLQEAAGSGTRRRYSFADLVELRVVKKLIDAGVDLRRVRHALEALRSQGENLATLTLLSDGSSIYACRCPEEVVDVLRRGQGVFGLALGPVLEQVRGTVVALQPPSRREEGPLPRRRSTSPGG